MRTAACILIVDDDEVDIMAIKRGLKHADFFNPIYVAKDGIDALEKLRANEIPIPRVILMDINMPRMDGITCMKEIRKDEDLKNTLIFVVTTSKDEGDKKRAYDQNAAGYIIKSDVGNELIKMVAMLDSYFEATERPT